jgi:hypothetical protein
MLSSATVQDSPPRPLIAELVAPDATSVAARRLAAVVVAITPLLVRVAWWWWSQGRAERDSVEPIIVTPALVEHTELRMTKRLLGRWKVRVVSTRWQPGAIPLAVAPNPPPRRPDGWRRQITLLGLTGLERAVGRQGPPAPAGDRSAKRLTGPAPTSHQQD